jgi:DNA-binding LacI/PurR family transcriptional regulator
MAKNGKTSLSQVAEHAGVSVTTASFVFNGKAGKMRISDECVARVLGSARELNYQGNYHARNLVRGTAMTLGFISVYLDRDVVRPQVTVGMMRRARERGYEVLNLSADDPARAYERGLRYVRQNRLDGLVAFMHPGTAVERLEPDVPIVHVWFEPMGIRPLVTLDPAPGIADAVEHLAGLGHRSILWLGLEEDGRMALPERRDAFRRAAAACGVRPREHALQVDAPATHHARTVAAFYRALMHAPARGMLPLEGTTAVMCYNDNMALALSMLLAQRGCEIPGDISIVGFDDVQAVNGVPPLSTVSFMFHEMGGRAVDVALQMIEEPDLRREYAGRVFHVPAEFIPRASTGPAAKESA